MPDDFHLLLKLIPIPVLLGAAGGVVPAFWPPAPTWRSYFQHFAAGLVTAVIAVDLLPEVREHGERVWVLGAFAVGSALMVGLKSVSDRVEERSRQSDNPVGLVAAAGADTFIDGVIIGGEHRRHLRDVLRGVHRDDGVHTVGTGMIRTWRSRGSDAPRAIEGSGRRRRRARDRICGG